MCSVEFVTILTKPRRNNGGTVNLIVRGLSLLNNAADYGIEVDAGSARKKCVR